MISESGGKGTPGDRAFTSFSPSRIAFPWCSSYISSADNTIRRQDKTHPPSSRRMMVGCVVLPCIIVYRNHRSTCFINVAHTCRAITSHAVWYLLVFPHVASLFMGDDIAKRNIFFNYIWTFILYKNGRKILIYETEIFWINSNFFWTIYI